MDQDIHVNITGVTLIDSFRLLLVKISIIFSLILCLGFGIVFFLLKAKAAVIMIGIAVILYSVTAFLFRIKKTLLARYLGITTLLMHISYVTFLFSPASGFHYYYFLLAVLTAIFFDVTKHLQLLSAIIFLAGALTGFFVFSAFPGEAAIAVPDETLRMLKISSIFLSILLLFIFFAYQATEIMKINKRLIQLATTDPLTKTMNRRMFISKGESEIQRCRRYKSRLSMLIIDVDFFKKINDTWGHDAGDKVLEKLSLEVSGIIRPTDFFSRLGGEEFGILLAETQIKDAVIAAERIRKFVEFMPVNDITEQGYSITISIGVSCFHSLRTNTLEKMMKNADKALYKAKDQGRNCVVRS